MKFWREIAVGACIGLSCLAIGGAVDVRDQGRTNAAEIRRVDDLQTLRYQTIIDRLNDLKDRK